MSAVSDPGRSANTMKRFLTFKGSTYYPSGGMDDFHADYDQLDEAVRAVVAHAQTENLHEPNELWQFSWAHVYDSVERRIVWTDADSPNAKLCEEGGK